MRLYLKLFAALVLVQSLSGCFVLVPFLEQQAQPQTPQPLSMHYFMEPSVARPAPKSPLAVQAAGAGQTAVSAQTSVTQDRLTLLLNQLKTGSTVGRTHAATDIGYLNVDKIPAILPLANALKNDDCKWVRRAAAKSLGKIGTSAVIPPLVEALNDKDKWVAHSAGNALALVQKRIK